MTVVNSPGRGPTAAAPGPAAAGAVIDVMVLVETFARAGVLGSAEVHFARMLSRLRLHERDTTLLGAALALRAPQWGHVCVELAVIADNVVIDDGGDGSVTDLPWPDPIVWAQDLAGSALVQVLGAAAADTPEVADRVDEIRPLVWDGTRLYLSRYWRYESNVADQINSRSRAADLGAVPRTFDDLFPTTGAAAQRAAAHIALARPMSVITGGPGTGKTHTIAGIVAALIDRHREETQHLVSARPLHVALAAPTGKAAQRMTEALRSGRDGVGEDTAAAMQGLEAQTIHRLLGARRGSFVHWKDNPLPADVVIVDETSMVSLPLMARLLDAARPEAQVILVGDPRQLASVEAGSVLRDLVDALPRVPSGLSGAGSQSGPGLVVELDQVYRQGEGSAIIPFARALEQGDVGTVMDVFADASTPITLVNPADHRALAALEAEVIGHASGVVAEAADPERALTLLAEMRVLTATRQGSNGRASWNRRVEAGLGLSGRSRRSSARWYSGRPVMVTENDYLNRLMNGDVGVVAATDPAGMVAFDRGGTVELVAASRLQSVDTVWAMTIHKSQGSEFAAVVIALPEAPSPLLTRELLYTAVTRAKERVTIVATEGAVRAAVGRTISRSSGLAIALAPLAAQLADRHDDPPEQMSLW